MAVQPNTTGYLSRSTNVPANGTGWTLTVWFRALAAPANYPTIIGVDASADDWALIDVAPGTLNLELELQGNAVGFGYAAVPILTLTANTWYFLALRVTGTGANNASVLYRASSSGSLTTVGPFNFPDVTWNQATILNDRFGGIFADAQARAFKLWHAALSDVELLAESFPEPPVRTSNIDSYLSLLDATDAGDDESGNARDWTVTGTLASIGIGGSVAASVAVPQAAGVSPNVAVIASSVARPVAAGVLPNIAVIGAQAAPPVAAGIFPNVAVIGAQLAAPMAAGVLTVGGPAPSVVSTRPRLDVRRNRARYR